jgi:hypothetical protein
MRGHGFRGGKPVQTEAIASTAANRDPSGNSIPNQVAVVSCLCPQRKA